MFSFVLLWKGVLREVFRVRLLCENVERTKENIGHPISQENRSFHHRNTPISSHILSWKERRKIFDNLLIPPKPLLWRGGARKAFHTPLFGPKSVFGPTSFLRLLAFRTESESLRGGGGRVVMKNENDIYDVGQRTTKGYKQQCFVYKRSKILGQTLRRKD